MKILVCVKRVVDPYLKVSVAKDGSVVETNGVKKAMNPFDEIAIEEALQLKEAGKAKSIVALSIGDDEVKETLRVALALGADSAIHVKSDIAYEPLNIAKIIKAIVERESPSLVFLGKQAVDGDHNQTGQMLAGLLNWPQGTFISKCEPKDDKVTIVREIDGGLETLSLNIPCVLTTDLRLNTPRYASLPSIMKAKQKSLESIAVSDLSLILNAHTKILNVQEPPAPTGGVFVDDVKSLVEKLKSEAKVLS